MKNKLVSHKMLPWFKIMIPGLSGFVGTGTPEDLIIALEQRLETGTT